MSYSTQLAFTYPLGSVIILDLAYQGLGIYSSDGSEGAWYVAGWSAKSDLKLSRDRRLAYMGEWEITSHVQTIIGSPEWKAFQSSSLNAARITQVLKSVRESSPGLYAVLQEMQGIIIPDPYLTPLLTPAASRVSPSYDSLHDTTQFIESLYTRGLMTICTEWSIIPDLPIDQAESIWRDYSSEHIGRFCYGGSESTRTLLFERAIRRGVIEPWHLTSVDYCLIDSLDQIPNDATPLHPLLILRRRIDQENRERGQEIRAYESAIQAELEAHREHEVKSALAFRKLYDGKNEQGRMLTHKWSATMLHFKTFPEMVASLREDVAFRSLYDAMMDSITIPTKRASLQKVLDWLRWKKGIDIPVPAESESQPKEDSRGEQH